MSTDDQWVREVIRTVESMSQQLVEFRQQINRVITPLYPRILEGEKRADREAAERAQRQKELDQRLTNQDHAIARQQTAIQQALNVLDAQTSVLTDIQRRQRLRAKIEGVAIVIIAGLWYAGRAQGWW